MIMLVKFETEKPVFYIAQIMVVHEEEYHVLFMRKTTGKINKLTFSSPKEVDAAFIRKKMLYLYYHHQLHLALSVSVRIYRSM